MNWVFWFGAALAFWGACSFLIGTLVGRMFREGWEDEDV